MPAGEQQGIGHKTACSLVPILERLDVGNEQQGQK
jgi:hypothetical protein